jgi:D-inositol-3-phosphate glycosyltransferase
LKIGFPSVSTAAICMNRTERPLRVLYSFPHKLGADRICYAAHKQVEGLANVGVDLLLFAGVLHKPLPASVPVRPTLAFGRARISYALLGTKRACALHDWIVSRRLRKLARRIDIIHAWPLGARRTLKAARVLGIPTVLERPNAHTRFAYEVVEKECERLGATLPAGHEHAFKEDWLRIEEEEYGLADRLLCPSDFVMRTFLDRGFAAKQLARHQYGFDEKIFHPGALGAGRNRTFTMLFAGGCAPRKGLHYALEAWLRSPAHYKGIFQIAGVFVPGYAERLNRMLSHPSIKLLGFRRDVPELMRNSDVLVLPSIEEGSALVTYEARGSGCVLLVSDATGASCRHGEDALVHSTGDVAALSEHITRLYEDNAFLLRLRAASLATAGEITWTAAARRLAQVYADIAAQRESQRELGAFENMRACSI